MLNKIIDFIKNNYLLKHILLMMLFIAFIIFMVLMWLRVYTNHGQKLELTDYTSMNINDAKKLASKASFDIVVSDSLHIVGKPGGMVLSQNPEAGSMVKENRKVYVTITKFDPDKIRVSDLPLLYGVDYEQKRVELGYRKIGTKIRGRKYDPGDPDYILEVWYNDELIINRDVLKADVVINKGDVLEFILSEKGGGQFLIPDLVCKTYSAAEFLLDASRLMIGDVREVGEVDDRSNAYIIAQDPPYNGESKMGDGSKINITISAEKPANCN
jgi:beta-lactam-binding protein with PASTA domain